MTRPLNQKTRPCNFINKVHKTKFKLHNTEKESRKNEIEIVIEYKIAVYW